MSARDRFLAKTRRSANGCLEWQGASYSSGHGSFWFQGKLQGAHRVAWILAHGPIPQGLWVLHRCDNPPCVDESHLFLGDRLANVRDMDAKGRRAPQAGEINGHARLAATQVEEIRSLRGQVSQRELGLRFGVSKTAVRLIQKGQRWPVREFPR